MIRIALAVAFLAALQDMGGGAPPAQEEKACDIAKMELRDYCANCKAWPAADQLDKNECKKCKSKVEKRETCVKSCWVCPKMHGGVPKRHSKSCCASKTCCNETPILALVERVCDTCKARSSKEADFKHAADPCAGKPRKICAESTKFPHGGEE